jgi:hypothetical protein
MSRADPRSLHPSLLLSILSTLSSQHFQLALSLPLLPATPGRDILIFSSLPSGGLSYRDNYAFHPSALTSVSAESRSESPVLVSPLAASPAPGTGTDSPTRSNTNTNPSPGGDSHGLRPCSGAVPRPPLRTRWTCLLRTPLVRLSPATMAGCSPRMRLACAWLRTTVEIPSWILEVVQVRPDSGTSYSRNRLSASARVPRLPHPARGATQRTTWVLILAPGRTDLEADCSISHPNPTRIAPRNGAWCTCLPPMIYPQRRFPLRV